MNKMSLRVRGDVSVQVMVFVVEAAAPTCRCFSPRTAAWWRWWPARAPPSCRRPWRTRCAPRWLRLQRSNSDEREEYSLCHIWRRLMISWTRFLFCFYSALKVSAMETPTRAEPVAQEDKTKLLKAAFLQFCRYVSNQLPNQSKSIIDCLEMVSDSWFKQTQKQAHEQFRNPQ